MTKKRTVRTEAAPAPFQGAPYSQAIAAGDFIFVAGQVGLPPGDTAIFSGTIETQTEQACQNLRAILQAAGSDLDQLVKATVYLANLDDFQAMNEVYRRFAGEAPPARATVAVGLPAGCLVEIDAIAVA